jgi:hypothetical protein
MQIRSTLTILQALLLAVLVVLATYLCLFIETLTRTTAELPIVIDKAIAREGILTRAAAERQIEGLSGKVAMQITSLRRDLFTRVDSLQARTFTELVAIRRDANQQIADTRTALVTELAKVSTPAGATIEQAQGLIIPAQNILARASDTSDILLDCNFNPDCIPNRVIPALKSVEKMAKAGERTMNAVADATPGTAQAVQSTSQDLSKIVKKFSRPVSWIKGMAGTAANIIGKFLGF